VENPSFEKGGGSLDGWIADRNPTELSLKVIPIGAHDKLSRADIQHSVQMAVPLDTSPYWISQRMIVCPSTTYILDFSFWWNSLSKDVTMVVDNCFLLLGWGNWPGDLSSVLSTAFGTVTGGKQAPENWVHVAWNASSPLILPATAANQTSAYLQVGMSCNAAAHKAPSGPYMRVDSIQIYPKPS
jgi:hypothetical protein